MGSADDINTLVRFCARRDVPQLTAGTADVAILFGGSILAGADVFAEAMRAGAADRYMIAGGEGHTTSALRETLGVHSGTEAALFDRYLRERHGLSADFLEQESTNCGNNVTMSLRLLRSSGVRHQRLILIQDATMQQRMDAGFRKHAPTARLTNYAAHRTFVQASDGRLSFVDPPVGMWSLEHYVTLLMGEIPRMTGYGPSGRDFIAHVDVPDEVRHAFDRLRADWPVRE
ncbi:ElyC/SanA/YdcF family protein [Actinoplanes sp. CA-131856]